MQQYTHKCIKCSEQYNDVDPDPYYCPPCNEQRKIIAQEIDKKQIQHSLPTKSFLQEYEEIRKAKGTQFVNIKDLGITL